MVKNKERGESANLLQLATLQLNFTQDKNEIVKS